MDTSTQTRARNWAIAAAASVAASCITSVSSFTAIPSTYSNYKRPLQDSSNNLSILYLQQQQPVTSNPIRRHPLHHKEDMLSSSSSTSHSSSTATAKSTSSSHLGMVLADPETFVLEEHATIQSSPTQRRRAASASSTSSASTPSSASRARKKLSTRRKSPRATKPSSSSSSQYTRNDGLDGVYYFDASTPVSGAIASSSPTKTRTIKQATRQNTAATTTSSTATTRTRRRTKRERIGSNNSTTSSNNNSNMKTSSKSSNNVIQTTPSISSNLQSTSKAKARKVATKSRKTAKLTRTKSRSSTMPGFMNRGDSKQRESFRHGLKLAQEANTEQVAQQIQDILTTKESERARRKTNSETMYQNSASVPDSLIAFTNEIHKECRITPSQEIELGNKTQEAIRLQQTYDTLVKQLGREPNDEEWCAASGKINMEAIRTAIEDGMQAKEQLVTANLRMVQGVVNLYIRNGLGSQYNAGDLMQEGTMALIRAAEKFEPKRGFRFSTYAMYWIRAAVKRSQIIQSRIISVPQRLHETHKKIMKVEKELNKDLGRKPTSEELAQAVGITVKQLDRCVEAFEQQCFSLDAELENTLNPNKGDAGGDTLYDVLGKKYEDAEYKQLQRFFMKEDLIDTLKRYLPAHEVDILLLRYGLMDERTEPHGFTGPLTIAEVSRLVGLKPDKVRRMINKSLRQLRHLIAHEWEDYENDLPLNL